MTFQQEQSRTGIAQHIAIAAIDRYRSRRRRKHGRCVFTPTCSEYARLAIERHGVVRGGVLAARRLLRCNGANVGVVDYPT
jgi:putative membrane protein insertion efficiency factor